MTNLEKWRDYQLDFFNDNDEIVDSINTNELIDVIEEQDKRIEKLNKVMSILRKGFNWHSRNPGGKYHNFCFTIYNEEDFRDLMDYLGTEPVVQWKN